MQFIFHMKCYIVYLKFHCFLCSWCGRRCCWPTTGTFNCLWWRSCDHHMPLQNHQPFTFSPLVQTMAKWLPWVHTYILYVQWTTHRGNVQAETSLQSKLNFKISATENTELTVFWLRSLLLCHDTHSDNLTDKPCTKTTETALDRQQLFLCCDHLDPFWPCYYFIAVFTDFKTVISHIVSYYSRHNIDKNNVLKFRFVHYIELTMLRECDAMYNTSLSVQEWELYLYLVMWPDRWLWRWQWWRIVDY